MPRGITRGTPQADADLETTRAQAPIGRSGRLCTAVLSCVSPFERLPVFRQKTEVFYHIPLEHTSRHRRIRNKTKSVTVGAKTTWRGAHPPLYSVAFSNAAIMRETRDFTWRTVAAGRFIRRATLAQLSPVASSSR